MLEHILDVRASLGLVTSAPALRGILRSVGAGTAKVFYDQHKIARGYVLWANVNTESVRCFARKGCYPSYPYEWQEGRFVLILETITMPGWLVSRHGPLRDFLRQQRTVLFRNKDVVTLYVRRPHRIIKKRYLLTRPEDAQP